jgi:hypothetical protein
LASSRLLLNWKGATKMKLVQTLAAAALVALAGVAAGFAQTKPSTSTNEQSAQKAPGEATSKQDSLQKEAPKTGEPGAGAPGPRGTDPNVKKDSK